MKKGDKVILTNGRGEGVVNAIRKGRIYVKMTDAPLVLRFGPSEVRLKPEGKEVIVDLMSVRLELTPKEYKLAVEQCEIPNSVNEKILTLLQERVKKGEGIIERFEED